MALLLALRKSPLQPQILVAPGSDAMAELARCYPQLKVEDLDGLVQLARAEAVDFCLVGPEVPLALGLVDALEAAGIPSFGPRQAAARIESSKAYAKNLMVQAGVPTARYQTYTSTTAALAALDEWDFPLVLKENGLKAGKGVAICQTKAEAQDHISGLELSDTNPLLFEEFLQGFEFSLICLASGEKFLPLPVAQDYKAIYDGQKGPNTGGMGAVSPLPRLSEEIYQAALDQVIKPTLKALAADHSSFTGFLYAGLMATDSGVKVIEFNARMGDPEAEVILPRLQGDLLTAICQLLGLATDQAVSTDNPDISAQADLQSPAAPQSAAESEQGEALIFPVTSDTCLGVVLSSPGYPGKVTAKPVIPQAFFEAAQAEGLEVIHMGTKKVPEGYQAAGGRVLMITCQGPDLAACRDKIYGFLQSHRDWIKDFHYRTDIGLAALAN